MCKWHFHSHTKLKSKGRKMREKDERKHRLTRKVTVAKGDSQEIAFHLRNKAQLGWMFTPWSWLDFHISCLKECFRFLFLTFFLLFQLEGFGQRDLDAGLKGRNGGGHMQQSSAQQQIGWLDWFSDLVMQLELVQELHMRQIKGPWWQLGVGASCSSLHWVVLDKLICPWCSWNKPVYILSRRVTQHMVSCHWTSKEPKTHF